MALTPKQQAELAAAYHRVQTGVGSETDKRNIAYAEKQGWKPTTTAPPFAPESPSIPPGMVQFKTPAEAKAGTVMGQVGQTGKPGSFLYGNPASTTKTPSAVPGASAPASAPAPAPAPVPAPGTGSETAFNTIFSKIMNDARDQQYYMEQKAKILKHMYDEPLSPDEMKNLPQSVQDVLNSRNPLLAGFAVSLLNDQIKGRVDENMQALQYMFTGYQEDQARIQKQIEAAQEQQKKAYEVISDIISKSPDLLEKLSPKDQEAFATGNPISPEGVALIGKYYKDSIAGLAAATKNTKLIPLYTDGVRTGTGIYDPATGKVTIQEGSGTANTADIQDISSSAALFGEVPTGTLTNENLDRYLESTKLEPPITSDMIQKASAAYQMPYEILTAVMQHESGIGTSSVADKNNNPGGITWSPEYEKSHPGVTRGSARPAAEGGYYVKFPTLQDGVNAVAEQIKKREVKYDPNPTGKKITVAGHTYDFSTYAADPNWKKGIENILRKMEEFGGTDAAPQSSLSSKSILEAANLSLPVFNYLTQGTPSLTRLSAAERQKIIKRAENWLNERGIDISSFQSRYKAYNEALQNNIQRYNNTKIAEDELHGTISNLEAAADEASFGSLTAANIAKIFAGQQVNDPAVQKYATHLMQLRSEMSLYNAAASGKSSPEKHETDEAEKAILSGISNGSLEGFRSAIEASTEKMDKVLQANVDRTNKQIWDLFGVGDKYKTISELKKTPDEKLSDDDAYAKYLKIVGNK